MVRIESEVFQTGEAQKKEKNNYKNIVFKMTMIHHYVDSLY